LYFDTQSTPPRSAVDRRMAR